jgi:hypothetical protein
MLSSKAGGDGPFLEGVVDRVSAVSSDNSISPEFEDKSRQQGHLRRPEILLHQNVHAPKHLYEQEVLPRAVQ